VELAHQRDAGERHLGEGRPSKLEVLLRLDPGRGRVHLLAPGPERALAAVGAAAQHALEGVRVGVREAQGS